MARPSTGKWVQGKELVLPDDESLYVYLPLTAVSINTFSLNDGEGVERKSTGKKDVKKQRSLH